MRDMATGRARGFGFGNDHGRGGPDGHTYLENRYATNVVLTFKEIEDLLGFTLPDLARLRQEWWTNLTPDTARPSYSDSWILASRTARPNLLAQTVVFERTP
jgi:hypothetical protein